MNGRCQKDALDRAEDICELCGNQYCAQCLLFPRGHRNPPTCKTCALANSGLRGGSTKQSPISRREYKKRKKELLAALEGVDEEEPAIEFFELKDPSPFDRSTELDRRPVVIEDEPTIDILAAEEAPSTIPPPPAAPPPPPEPAVREPASLDDEAMDGLAPVDTSINPLALGEPVRREAPPTPQPPAPQPSVPATASEESTSAAELLARLKADQPIQSQFSSPPVGIDTDPFAQAAPATPAPAVPAPAAPAASAPAPQTPVTSASGAWSPPTPPPRGSNLDAPEAPANAAIAAPTQASPFDAPTQASPFNAPTETSPFDAPATEAPKRRKADTDDSGQWIPPSLRGMAEPDERDPLPKRR